MIYRFFENNLILGEQSKLGTHECKGKVIQVGKRPRGRVRQRGYDDIYHCRWEVIAPEGKQIKVKYIRSYMLELVDIGWLL